MPNPAALTAGRACWSRDYPTSFADLRLLMRSGLDSAEAAREAMLAGYRRIPFDMAPAYAEIFRRLVAGEVPLVFNCSAGKDRAGVAAALVLSALGVARADVMADYALTAQAGLQAVFTGAAGEGSVSRTAMRDAIFACEPAYIGAAFAAIEAAHGTQAIARIVGLARAGPDHQAEHALRPVRRIGIVAEPVGLDEAARDPPLVIALLERIDAAPGGDDVVLAGVGVDALEPVETALRVALSAPCSAMRMLPMMCAAASIARMIGNAQSMNPSTVP